MSIEQISNLPLGCMIMDDRTGEELKFNGIYGNYVMGIDDRGTIMYLIPERVVIHE